MLGLKPPIIVIGMHRSGTSLISRYLDINGVFMGEALDVNHESIFFIKKNDQLLEEKEGTWNSPVPVINSKYKLSKFELLKHFGVKRKPFSYFRNISNYAWGWKDPRNTFTLPYWLSVFPKAKVLHVYRNGIDSAYSLVNRNDKLHDDNVHKVRGLTVVDAFELWEKYVAEALNYASYENYFELKYESLGEEEITQKLACFLDMQFEQPINSLLRRKSSYKANENYKELQRLGENSLLMKALGYINQ